MSTWKLVSLFAVFSFTSFGAQPSLPVDFSKTTISYSVLSMVFDIDASLKDVGLNAYACRLENSLSGKNYYGVGPCILESIKHNFNENKASTIWVWVLNEEGKYLPPIKLIWKNSHKGWKSLSGEFLFMYLEGVAGFFVKKSENHVSVSANGTCAVNDIPNRDLGNFLGELEVHIPPGRRLSEYLKFSVLEGIKTDLVSISAQVPFYLNKKRAYKAKLNYTNEGAEAIQLSVLTNFNMLTQRNFCISGNFSIQQPKTDIRVLP